MKLLSEFKTFAMKGNVMDMAVGIIIGAAFGKIISSLVNDVIMPPIGLVIGGVNFSELSIVLKEAVGESLAVSLNYGSFLQVVFDFLIVAWAVFFVVKFMNRAKRKKEEAPKAPPVPSNQEVLLAEIRDLLKKEN